MVNAAFLLLAVTASASPTTLWMRQNTPKWEEVKCTDTNITDAKVASNIRWQAADANTSWDAAVAAWHNYIPGDGQVQLKFPAFISDFYGGPEGWDCQDPVNTPCSTTVQCADTKTPAGYVISPTLS